MNLVHEPVMTRELLEYCAPVVPDGLMIDGTLGEGGHSAAFLAAHPRLRLVGIDADPTMIHRAQSRLAQFEGRTTLVQSWFDEYFSGHGVVHPAGDGAQIIILDLGLSMFHFRGAGRGFSFVENGPLDMRLSPNGKTTAADLVNDLPEARLADLVFTYGEERYSRRIASAICRNRPITTSLALAELIRRTVPPAYRRGRIHPATRTFQALRIVVNDELGRIGRALPAAAARLAKGGNLGVISFHSLEDRLVKRIFRVLVDPAWEPGPGAAPKPGAQRPTQRTGEMSAARAYDFQSPQYGGEGREFSLGTKKPVTPSQEEIERNPAASSAKLRVLRCVSEAAA